MTRRRLAIVAILAVLLGIAVWLGGRQLRDPDTASVEPGESEGELREGRATSSRHRTAQPRDDVGTLRLEGQVIDADERPVGGVSIGIDTRPPRVTVTEADGSFGFDGLAERTYRVGGSKDDLRADAVSVRLGPTTEPVTLRLRRGNPMLVRVQDEEGAPIAGARVFRRGLVERDQRTGPDGTTLLRGLGSGWERVRIEADGYAPGWIGLPMPNASAVPIERVVTLRRGAAVRGIVRSPAGTPVAGASVAIGRSELDVETDANGAWEMPAVAAATATFVATADGFAPGSSDPVELDGSTTREGVVIELRKGLAIGGVVVDEDGAPVAGAKVSAAIGYTTTHVWTDDHGNFRLTGLADGVHELAAFHGDRGSDAIRTDAREEATELRLVVVDTTIRGVVVDETGEPVVDAEIWAMMGNPGASLRGEDDAVTDSSGAFVIGPLVAGDYKVNAAYPAGGETNLFAPMVEARTGQHDVRIVLPTAASIRGRVTANGAAVASFVVAVDDFQRPDYRDAEVFASNDGGFEIRKLAPGTYILAIAGDSFARHTLWTIRLGPGEDRDLGAIAVEPGRTIRGRVISGEGKAIEGALVEVGPARALDGGLPGYEGLPFKRELEGVRTARSGVDGAFAVEHVADDVERWETLGLIAGHADHGRSTVQAAPAGDEVVEITLAGVGDLRGTVRGLRAGDRVVIRIEETTSNRTASASLDGDGRFRVGTLAPGSYRVVASMFPQMTTVTATAEIRSGETTTVELSFASHNLTLVVDTVDLACSILLLQEPSGFPDPRGFVALAHCEDDGHTEIAGLTAGTYELCLGATCKPVTIAESPATQTFFWR